MRVLLHHPLKIEEIGRRANQEDYVFPSKPTEDDRLFILCDGMGGHDRGEVASRNLAEGIAAWYKKYHSETAVMTDALFKEAFESGCRHLDKADRGAAGGLQMGTTLTLLCFHKGGCLAAHVGDSRIYHIRPTERSLLYKSKDHSLVCELYEAGEITFSEMSTSSQRNVITRAVMPGIDNRVEADVVHITDIKPGDYFYLCSDGMLERMADDELVDLFSDDISDEEKRDQLVSATTGNKDNHSALIIHVADVVKEVGDSQYVGDEHTSPYNALLMRRDDDDDEGTITIVDEQPKEDEHTAYSPVTSSGQKTPSQQIGYRPSKTNDNKGCARFRSWLSAMAIAILAAALVVAVYYFISI